MQIKGRVVSWITGSDLLGGGLGIDGSAPGGAGHADERGEVGEPEDADPFEKE